MCAYRFFLYVNYIIAISIYFNIHTCQSFILFVFIILCKRITVKEDNGNAFNQEPIIITVNPEALEQNGCFINKDYLLPATTE